MLKETGLLASHQSEGSVESQTRAENLAELLNATREFDKARAAQAPVVAPAPIEGEDNAPLAQVAPPLQAFLEQISLVGDADADVGEGKVSVMTLHAAKGLEFDAVFMLGMEEDLFPHRRATAPDADPEEMSEERRLCYVGFTRARRRLFVSLATSRVTFGELKFNPPSRFLSEVPKELFGFAEALPAAQPRMAQPPRVRRRYGDDDDVGPRVDHSYDQSAELAQHSGDVKGLRVTHSQFGRGVVLDARGQGPTAKLLVRFETVGEKTVVARFLTPG
jgi:DNA helicase-2/ATP-dependent DNA helicase PcrA